MKEPTPGPWMARQFGNSPQWIVSTVADDWHAICTTSQENDMANAIAIAALPDLLAAAEAAVREENCHSGCPWCVKVDDENEHRSACPMASLEAAIATAKGE